MSLTQEIKEIKSSPKELREFGCTLGIFFAVIASISLWRHHGRAPVFFILAVIFLFFGIFLPIILKPFQKIWMGLALLMGAVMSRVILCILFYLVVTPIGLLARCFGKDFLSQSRDRNRESYWIDRPTEKQDALYYEKQF